MTDEQKRQKLDEMYTAAKRKFPRVHDITAEELRARWINEQFVVVDVRQPHEQAVSMIDGAIKSSDFEENSADYQGRTIVPYCTIGGRSGIYSELLMSAGWNVLNLKGSILAWTLAGGALQSSTGPTKKVHVNAQKFDLVADGYEAIW
jgi:rhodanese-related sulfurtransferase